MIILLSSFCFISSTLALILPQPTPTATTQTAFLLQVRETNIPPATTLFPTGTFTTTKYIILPGVTNEHVTLPAKTIELALPTCIQTITPDKNGYVPPDTCGSNWAYYPSFAVALAFAALFGSLLALHIWQAARYKIVSTSMSFIFTLLKPHPKYLTPTPECLTKIREYRNGVGSSSWLRYGRH